MIDIIRQVVYEHMVANYPEINVQEFHFLSGQNRLGFRAFCVDAIIYFQFDLSCLNIEYYTLLDPSRYVDPRHRSTIKLEYCNPNFLDILGDIIRPGVNGFGGHATTVCPDGCVI